MSKPHSIILLRHGMTEHNHGFYGSTDSQLTDEGMQAMLDAVAEQPFDQIISSPLQRCERVARLLAAQRGCDYLISPDWREYHFGDWEAMPIQQLWDEQPEALTQFWQNPNQFSPPNAENFSHFLQRLDQAKSELNQHASHKKLLVITHAGVIRGLRLIAQQTTASEWLTYPVEHASKHQLCANTGRIEPICTA